MRLLIIDDHPIVAQGCSNLLSAGIAAEILTASDVLEGFCVWRKEQPDIVMVDLSFQQRALAGISFIRRLHQLAPQVPILAFSMHRDPIIVRRTLMAGAMGYLNKDAPPGEIAIALGRIKSGRRYVAADLAADLALLPSGIDGGFQAEFTKREEDIIALLAEGKPYRDISRELGISYKTVANVSSILKSKLEAATLPELVAKAIQLNGAL